METPFFLPTIVMLLSSPILDRISFVFRVSHVCRLGEVVRSNRSSVEVIGVVLPVMEDYIM
jgi:hypothetical protein